MRAVRTRILYRERTKEYVVDEAEDRRVGANSKSKRGDHDRGEGRGFQELADGELQVSHQDDGLDERVADRVVHSQISFSCCFKTSRIARAT
jgi:hypothetical protein